MNNHPEKLEKMKRRHIVATSQLRLSCSGECEGRMMLNNFVQKNKMHFLLHIVTMKYPYYERKTAANSFQKSARSDEQKRRVKRRRRTCGNIAVSEMWVTCGRLTR